MTPEKTVARLSLYRRLLKLYSDDGSYNVYSHQLAEVVKVTPAQVRRDLMVLGYNGSPKKGYEVSKLAECIDSFFHASENVGVALVGIGNIGRAMLSYFRAGKNYINIIAAFDLDPNKVNRVINNCRSYSINEMPSVLKEFKINTAILAVPVGQAQSIAELLVNNGVKGILNFTPIRLKLPKGIFVEDVDITMHLEKVTYFSNIVTKSVSDKNKKEGGKNG
jgi:redox-sensing transcriptional repressor